jgi:hypothetical protein
MGGSRVTLLLGKTDNAETYAKDASKPAIVMVAPTIVEDLNKKIDDFRRKELFDLRSFSTRRLEVARGADKVAYEKSTADGKDVWKDSAGKVVDTTKVEDLVNKLSSLRAQSFANGADPALKTPVVIVTANFGENKDENLTETVTLARAGQAAVASRPDEPGTLKLEGMGLDDIVKALDALK